VAESARAAAGSVVCHLASGGCHACPKKLHDDTNDIIPGRRFLFVREFFDYRAIELESA
jgi:hypothetical protein